MQHQSTAADWLLVDCSVAHKQDAAAVLQSRGQELTCGRKAPWAGGVKVDQVEEEQRHHTCAAAIVSLLKALSLPGMDASHAGCLMQLR